MAKTLTDLLKERAEIEAQSPTRRMAEIDAQIAEIRRQEAEQRRRDAEAAQQAKLSDAREAVDVARADMEGAVQRALEALDVLAAAEGHLHELGDAHMAPILFQLRVALRLQAQTWADAQREKPTPEAQRIAALRSELARAERQLAVLRDSERRDYVQLWETRAADLSAQLGQDPGDHARPAGPPPGGRLSLFANVIRPTR